MGDKNASSFVFDGFISYSRKDEVWVKRLIEALSAHGATTWVDEQQILPGDSIPAAVNKGLQTSRKLVVILTRHYTESDWCAFENAYGIVSAIKGEKRLLPLLVEDCEVPPLIGHLLYIDFRKPDEFALRVRQLVSALEIQPKEQEAF